MCRTNHQQLAIDIFVQSCYANDINRLWVSGVRKEDTKTYLSCRRLSLSFNACLDFVKLFVMFEVFGFMQAFFFVAWKSLLQHGIQDLSTWNKKLLVHFGKNWMFKAFWLLDWRFKAFSFNVSVPILNVFIFNFNVLVLNFNVSFNQAFSI